MLKCLIVDDELISREGVFEALDWQSLGIEVVGLGKNGEEGLQLFKQYQPDMVITDVKMPIMDGLQMVEQIVAEKLRTKIILISAYSEFAYAQQAIRFGVKNYLLKPVEDHELLQAVQELAAEIKREQLQGQDGQLRSLLEQEQVTAAEGEAFVLVLAKEKVQVDEGQTVKLLADGQYHGRYLQVLNVQKNTWPHFLAQQTQGYFSALSSGDNLQAAYEEVSNTAFNAQYWELKALSWNLVLKQRHKWLTSAVMRRETLGTFVEHYPNTASGRVSTFRPYMENLLRMLQQFKGIEADEVWRYCYEILLSLEKSYFIFGDDSLKLKIKDQLARATSFSQLAERFTSFIEETLDNREEVSAEYNLIRRIKYIVHTRFAEDISSKSIAEEVFLTPNYMGKVFRDITGYYLNDYILDVRLNKARQLLAQTDQSIAEIAGAVGIGSASYFTSLFKKIYKQTPKEFRRSNS